MVSVRERVFVIRLIGRNVNIQVSGSPLRYHMGIMMAIIKAKDTISAIVKWRESRKDINLANITIEALDIQAISEMGD